MSSKHGSSSRRMLLAGVVSSFLAIPGASADQSTATKEAIDKGRTTFLRYCVSCHGKEAKGDGSLAKDLRVPVPDLGTLSARSGGTFPYDRVVQIISKGNEVRAHGTNDMPAWGPAFNRTDGIEAPVDEAIRNLAHYLGSVQRPK